VRDHSSICQWCSPDLVVSVACSATLPPTRFESVFLEYINDARYKWRVYFGIPYGMNVWQVGDHAEQNSAFKITWKKRKEFILQEKSWLPLEFKIEKQNIVGIVHYTWNASFARVETMKKAIASRGWHPENYILMDSKVICRK
jgi:hypothetical protein